MAAQLRATIEAYEVVEWQWGNWQWEAYGGIESGHELSGPFIFLSFHCKESRSKLSTLLLSKVTLYRTL